MKKLILFIILSVLLAGSVSAMISSPPSPWIGSGDSASLNKGATYSTEGTFTDADTDPSIKSSVNWATANTGATTIDDFDDGIAGQIIIIRVADANTTFDFTTSSLKGNAGSDYAATENDLLKFYTPDGATWYCTFIGKAAGGVGEANTASSVGVGGVAVFKQKTGVDLELRSINAASAMISVALDAGNNEIDIDVADAELVALAGVVSAANKLPYFTGLGAAAVADLTAFARSILDDADEATFKATVNLEAGTDFYDIATADAAFEAELDNSAGLLAALDDETGGAAGALAVFGINPTLLDLTLGDGTGDAITQTAAAYDWDLIDDNPSALSFDAAGKAGILVIVTSNAAEGVTMSGTLGVTGAATFSGGIADLGTVAVGVW
ncbi:MAG: hypothetical protein ACYSR9_06655, partial [Planctomycetota bacterium]